MSLISFTALQDGVTGINAAATNTPLSTIYNDYNGNITDANISSSAAISFSKIAGGSANSLVSWASWTPSYNNLTVGNGTVLAKYVQIGKTVHFYYQLVWGSTTSISGNITISLPVAAVSDYITGIGIGTSEFQSSGAANISPGTTVVATTSTFTVFAVNSASTYAGAANLSSTIPFTWGTSYVLFAEGTYQAA